MANSTKKTFKPTSRKISRAPNKDSKDNKDKKYPNTKKFTKSKPNKKKTVKFFPKPNKFTNKDKPDRTENSAKFAKPKRSSAAHQSSKFDKIDNFDEPAGFLEADDFTAYMTQEKPTKFQRSAKTSTQKSTSRYGKPDKFSNKNKFEKSTKFDDKHKSTSKLVKKPAQFGKPVQLVDQELIYGIHPIIELLKAKKRKLYKIYTTNPEPKNWAQIARLLPNYTEIVYKERAGLDNLAQSTDHQSVVGLVSPFIFRKQFFAPKLHPFLLLLDNIQDTRNLGAILRSAYCTGVTGVILTTRHSAPITSAVLKASAGLAEHLEIHLTPNATLAVQTLKDNGCKIYLATVDESKNAADLTYELPVCLVIGNEATGISKSIMGAGQHITIPQINSEVSYNASVAAGILCFLISNQNKLIK